MTPLQSLSKLDAQLRADGPTAPEQLPQKLVLLSLDEAQVCVPALQIPLPSTPPAWPPQAC